MTLEEEQNDFYQALGLAVSRWAHVEHALFDVFCQVLQCQQWSTASAAFHAAASFNVRRDMTSAAVRTTLTDVSPQEEWTRIHADLGTCAKRRGQLVHWAIFNDTGAGAPPGRRVYLRPLPMDINVSLKYLGKDMPSMYLDEVKACVPQFHELSARLRKFRNVLKQQLAPPQ